MDCEKTKCRVTGLWEFCIYLEWKETSRDPWSNKMPAYLAVGRLRGLFRCFERNTSLRHVGSRRRQTAMFLLQAGFLQKVRLWHNGSAKENTRTWGSAWGRAFVLACMPNNLHWLAIYLLIRFGGACSNIQWFTMILCRACGMLNVVKSDYVSICFVVALSMASTESIKYFDIFRGWNPRVLHKTDI